MKIYSWKPATALATVNILLTFADWHYGSIGTMVFNGIAGAGCAWYAVSQYSQQKRTEQK